MILPCSRFRSRQLVLPSAVSYELPQAEVDEL